ncbi:MAG: hypothetical protein KBS85_00950 [Lachnospiraceae bacterium]|nr:hypothetical protein [Candidatus Merdinaster equi]
MYFKADWNGMKKGNNKIEGVYMKKMVIAAIGFVLFGLVGCASYDEKLAEDIKNQSGIMENEAYLQYMEYDKKHALDENGYVKKEYVDDLRREAITEKKKEGKVYLTFARNSMIDARYFLDSDHKEQIDTSYCFINAGDTVYATSTLRYDENEFYSPKGYRLYSYVDDRKSLVQEIGMDGVIQIPESATAGDYAIEPYGEYVTVQLNFKASYTDDLDKEKPADDVKWYVGDREVKNGTFNLEKDTDMIITCKYDADRFFLLSSTPEYYYHDMDKVIFKQRDSDENNYELKLKEYLTVSLYSDVERIVQINDEDEQRVDSKHALSIEKLKYGDTVRIRTDKEWKMLESYNSDLVITNYDKKGATYIYTLVVPEKGSEFVFDPMKYNYEHGSIDFYCFNKLVTTTQYLAKGTSIYYEAKDVEEGFMLAPGTHRIVVGDHDETERELNSISFAESVNVRVELNQPAAGGKIIYYLDDELINGKSCETISGKTIKMQIQHWEGWKCDYKEATYTVSTDPNQTATINNTLYVDEIFIEDDEHKPELTVTVDQSVGTDMLIRVDASGQNADREEQAFESGFLVSDKKVVDALRIGTEQPVYITLTNRALQDGKAVKFEIEKEEISGNIRKQSPIYFADLTDVNDYPVQIYSKNEYATTKVWYKAVRIKISLVDVLKYKNPQTPSHATLLTKYEDSKSYIKDGDLIEGNRNVLVSISPERGYYICGDKVIGASYVNTMCYSDYIRDIDKIINDHPAKKFNSVSLRHKDSFATYKYWLDGKEVDGNISYKDGQKLKLEYTITDDVHKFSENKGGWLFGIGSSDKNATLEVELKEEHNGTEVDREFFGILLDGEV